MEARLPLYIVASIAVLFVVSVGVAFLMRLPARASLPGIPAPVTVQVGSLPNEYASAVSTRLLDLLLTWTQENRRSRFRDAARLMNGSSLARYKQWARSSMLELETMQIEQRARLTPLTVKRLGPDFFVTEIAVDVRRYAGGLGGGTEHFTYTLLLKRLPDGETRPTVLSVVGIKAQAFVQSPTVEQAATSVDSSLSSVSDSTKAPL